MDKNDSGESAALDSSDDVSDGSERNEEKAPVFSQEEAHELEELLRSIIGNKA